MTAALAKGRAVEGARIAFGLSRYDRDKASELVKRLVDQWTSSNGGTYLVRRKRLFDEIPHVRLIRMWSL